MLLVNDEKKIIFVTIYKSNCTVIAKIFFNYINKLREALKHNKWIHVYEQDIYIKKNLLVQNKNYDNYLKLIFVRNPYERAVSSYLHVMCCRREKELSQDLSFF